MQEITHSADAIKRRIDYLSDSQRRTLSPCISFIAWNSERENKSLLHALAAFHQLSEEGKEAAAAHLSHLLTEELTERYRSEHAAQWGEGETE